MLQVLEPQAGGTPINIWGVRKLKGTFLGVLYGFRYHFLSS